MNRTRETIVAPATAPGHAALAVVRLSGPEARGVLDRVFRRVRGERVPVRRPVLGNFLDRGGRVFDEGTVVFFASPRSYTGEDLVEMTLHGSPALVRELVAACVAAGARHAGPGEFTLRALENGKITLAEAEAVRDLVEAATLEQARVAVRQLGGEVGGTIGPLAEAVLDLLADVEAGLDFAEEEQALVEAADNIAARCTALGARIDAVLAASDVARRVREGARVVLLGPPNAGKSSLFNRLVGDERVIVTDEPGTTRDVIEETVTIEGIPVALVDAAGVGVARGSAELEGMRRAREAAERADLVLDVYSLTSTHRPQSAPGARRLRVATHGDVRDAAAPELALALALAPAPASIVVSSVTGEGIDELRRAIGAALEAPGDRPLESVALATERHRAAARCAREALDAARDAARAGLGAELVAIELRTAARALREILGEVTPEELLGRIFARFCIGK